MIRIVVHSPKGGVGKTTLATNIALFLARQGHNVWALDLAGGGMMAEFLHGTKEFSNKQRSNAVTVDEMGELPLKLPGARKFDYAVADTDDYYKILASLIDKKRIGWRAIAPILPADQDQTGLIKIPKETSELMTVGTLALDESPKLCVVMNKCPQQEWEQRIQEVSKAMQDCAVRSLLSDVWIPQAESRYHPYFIDQPEFWEAIERLLVSIGV